MAETHRSATHPSTPRGRIPKERERRDRQDRRSHQSAIIIDAAVGIVNLAPASFARRDDFRLSANAETLNKSDAASLMKVTKIRHHVRFSPVFFADSFTLAEAGRLRYRISCVRQVAGMAVR